MSIYDKASLVLIPSGSKTSKVYSQKPTNGDGDFTFSRSTAATRVNASGNIEKETQNLLTYSNDFGNAAWSKNNATLTSGQSGYDGTNNAWKLESIAIAASAYISQPATTPSVKTMSVYAKAGSYDYAIVQCGGGTASYTWFDLTNGLIGTEVNVIESKIESVGGGWYRCSITAQGSHTGGTIYAAPSNGGVSVSGGNYIYIQDAQLEQGLVARDYIETTTTAIYGGITDNVPRLDYTDSSCPALLLEPQRTNLLEDSEYFGSSYWGSARVSVFTNNAVSPEGFQNASYIEQQSGNTSAGGIFNGTIFTASAHTQSIFAKKKEKGFIALAENASAGNLRYSWFDIENGNIGTINGGHTAKIEDYGNGWYRCSITYTAINTGSGYSAFYYLSDTDNSISVDGSGGLYVYGAQLEAGSYATSYIPTYGSAVTRNIDNMQIASGISDLLPQGTGTMYVEGTIVDAVDTESYLMRIEQASFSNTIFIARSTAGNLFVSYRDGNSTLFSMQKNNVADTFKAAFAFESGNSVLYVNGEQVGTSSVTYTPSVTYDDIRIGGYSANTANMSGLFSQGLVFKTRLSNEELATLTTI